MRSLKYKKSFQFEYDLIFFLIVLFSVVFSVFIFLFLLYLYMGCRAILIDLSFNIDAYQTAESVFYTSLIISAISLLVGYACFIVLYFHRGHRNQKFSSLDRMRILNDVAFLFPSFFHWFVKLSFSFFIALILQDYPYLFDDFWTVLPLLFLVLFLDISKTIVRKMTSSYRLKFLGVSLLILSISSISMAVLATPTIDKSDTVLQQTTHFVELPELNKSIIRDYLGESNFYRSSIHIKYIPSKNNKNYILDRQTVSLKELDELLKKSYSDPRYRFDIALYAEKSFSMNEKVNFERMLFQNEFEIVNYIFKTPKNEFGYSFYNKLKLPLERPDMVYAAVEDPIIIKMDDYSINNEKFILKRNDLFEKGIKDQRFFVFQIGASTDYQNYLDFIVSYKNIVMSLRKQSADLTNPDCGESYLFMNNKNCQDLFELQRHNHPLKYRLEYLDDI